MLAEDLDISTDGTIYFTDASDSFGVENYILDLLEGRPHGRLLSYDPFTKTVTTLLDKLYFANGVVLSTNEDFVLVNETYRYRIRRYWLKGNKAGSNDIFIDNLPGFPDNITSNKNGVYHLALFTIRNPILDFIHPYPFLSSTVAKLPGFLWTKPEPYGFVISLDESGKILNTYQDTKGALLKGITSVIEFDGYLYLGSLHEDKIGKLKL
jgi:sugar lactone lactonase YvrE